MKKIDGGKIEFSPAVVEFDGAGISPAVKHVAANVIGKARQIVRESENADPVLFFGDAETGECGIVGTRFGDRELSKEAFAQVAKKICKDSKATFAIFLSESWAVRTNDKEAYEKWRAENPDADLGEHPDSIDCLMVSVETLHGSWMCQLEIKKGDRDIDISKVKFDKLQASGRLANFLAVKTVNN